VSAHEPPLLAIVADDPELQSLMHDVQAKVQSVLELLEGGDIASGTRQFVENVALGPGMWEQLPEQARDVMMNNASTFLDEQRDPEWATLGLTALADFPRPVLLTQGDRSPRWFIKIIEALAQAAEHAEVSTIAGAGHVPHASHPVEYVAMLTYFVQRSR
jgi:pimeloyl-ACP methyl ester carboxylesterase